MAVAGQVAPAGLDAKAGQPQGITAKDGVGYTSGKVSADVVKRGPTVAAVGAMVAGYFGINERAN